MSRATEKDLSELHGLLTKKYKTILNLIEEPTDSDDENTIMAKIEFIIKVGPILNSISQFLTKNNITVSPDESSEANDSIKEMDKILNNLRAENKIQ